MVNLQSSAGIFSFFFSFAAKTEMGFEAINNDFKESDYKKSNMRNLIPKMKNWYTTIK